jgi:hypothetical protein
MVEAADSKAGGVLAQYGWLKGDSASYSYFRGGLL